MKSDDQIFEEAGVALQTLLKSASPNTQTDVVRVLGLTLRLVGETMVTTIGADSTNVFFQSAADSFKSDAGEQP